MSVSPIVTRGLIESYIEDVNYAKVGDKTTVCCIIFNFGIEVVGFVHSQDLKSYNYREGCEYSYDNAIDNSFPIVIAYVQGRVDSM